MISFAYGKSQTYYSSKFLTKAFTCAGINTIFPICDHLRQTCLQQVDYYFSFMVGWYSKSVTFSSIVRLYLDKPPNFIYRVQHLPLPYILKWNLSFFHYALLSDNLGI